ncbi:MAG: transcriptional regulator NrdR [Actinomycetota bacterium]
MHCPFCSGSDTRVIDSRDTESGAAIRRRRECSTCEQRFTTFERIWGVPVVVLKRDGAREPFDRAKVVSGIAKACKNRPVTDEQMRRVCDEIEEAAREKGAEISSTDIGREVLTRLKALDEVAYVRFASVYREFQEVGEFARVIRELETRGHVGGRG